MAVRERILTMGITGSGKSYQWLKMAESLLPTGAIFRCIDTDNAIDFMLEHQFSKLMPENGGNVYVFNVYDWQDYKIGLEWMMQGKVDPKQLTPMQKKAYGMPVKPDDWNIIDMIDNAWSTVQKYFVSEIFEESIGDYFLNARKELRSRGDVDKKGKPAVSVMPETLSGWMDWPVVNKLYDDWILPIVYRSKCHLYATTKVQQLSGFDKKDPEIMSLFGGHGVRPSGQKNIGHQTHTIFLMIPGNNEWYVSTIKDRGGREYFKKDKLTSLFFQYLVGKAHWDIP